MGLNERQCSDIAGGSPYGARRLDSVGVRVSVSNWHENGRLADWVIDGAQTDQATASSHT